MNSKLKVKRTAAPAEAVAGSADVPEAPKRSSLVVLDIPVGRIEDSPENPNEQDDETFGELVEALRESKKLDEPCIVVPMLDAAGKETGKYLMVSGHHRKRAAVAAGFEEVPCVVNEGWDNDRRKIELVRRNILRGNLNPEKFTKLYNEMAGKYDKEILKKLMGFTRGDAFDKVYKAIQQSLPTTQRKKLEEAKENIRSVDDLSSVLNTIFKEHGSDLEYGFMVFSFGGKDHHYIKADAELDRLVKAVEKECKSSGEEIGDVFKRLLKGSK